jgi:hypothetical protein
MHPSELRIRQAPRRADPGVIENRRWKAQSKAVRLS